MGDVRLWANISTTTAYSFVRFTAATCEKCQYLSDGTSDRGGGGDKQRDGVDVGIIRSLDLFSVYYTLKGSVGIIKSYRRYVLDLVR